MRRRIYFAVSIPVFVLLYSYTAVTVLLIILFSSIRLKRVVYALIFVWANTIFLMMDKKIHIEGRKNMLKNKKYILIANHTSMFDIMAIMSFKPEVSWLKAQQINQWKFSPVNCQLYTILRETTILKLSLNYSRNSER